MVGHAVLSDDDSDRSAHWPSCRHWKLQVHGTSKRGGGGGGGGGGRGGAQWKKKRSIRRRGLCGILPCEDKLTPLLLCPFGVVSSLCKCGNLLTVGCVQYHVDNALGNGVQCKCSIRTVGMKATRWAFVLLDVRLLLFVWRVMARRTKTQRIRGACKRAYTG